GTGGGRLPAGRQAPGPGQPAGAGLPQRGGRAAALGVDEQRGVGLSGRLTAQLLRADPGVHMAFAHPDVDVVAPGLAADVRAEELVGEEEHLALGRYRRDDLYRIRPRAAHVRLGFDLRAGVDIRDHDRAGALG